MGINVKVSIIKQKKFNVDQDQCSVKTLGLIKHFSSFPFE